MIKVKEIAITLCFGLLAIALTYGISGYGGFATTYPSTVVYGQIAMHAVENETAPASVGVFKYVYMDSATISGRSLVYDVDDTTTFSTYHGCKTTIATATNVHAYAGVAMDTYTAGTGGWIQTGGNCEHALYAGTNVSAQGNRLYPAAGSFGLDIITTDTSYAAAYAGQAHAASAGYGTVRLLNQGF